MEQEPRYGVGPLQREMSEFHCRELLLSYLEGTVSDDAAAAIEKVLEQSPQAQQELEALRQANSYAEKLSGLELDQKQVDLMLENLGLWTKVRVQLKPRNWPDSLKIASEAMLVLVSLFLVGILVPWDLVKDKLDIFAGSDTPLVESRLDPLREDVETVAATEPTTRPEVDSSLEDAQPAVLTAMPTADTPTLGAEAPAAEVEEVAAEVEEVAAEVEEVAEDTTSEAEDAQMDGSGHEPEKPQVAAKTRGEVYKLFMDLSNLDVLTPEIADRIRELGGAKAGQVPLGWRRTNGSYFHFSIDEENYGALQTMLREYGSLRTIRESHSRVMPEGVRRIILWVERVPTSSQPQVEKEVSSGDNSNTDEPSSTVDYE